MFLETTFCIDLLREARVGGGPATSCLKRHEKSVLSVPVFVACELHAGARLSAVPDKQLRVLERFLERIEIVYPDDKFAVAYGEAEATLRQSGNPILTMDLLIGIMAKMHGRILITRDYEHYARIPGLVLETY